MSAHAAVQKRQHEESAPQNMGRGKSSQGAGVGLPLFMQTNPTASARITLQRKCACGGTPGANDECETCNSGKFLQTKLAIGASDDPLEQEADRVADQVLAMPENSTVSAAPPRIQRYTGQATGETGTATGETGTAPASVDRVLASSGRPLDATLQQDMGQRFGHDFSRVRVHSGSEAEQSARDVSAHAYTVGYNLIFGAGQFAPETHAGRRLIAHELTHVVQQSSSDGDRTEPNNWKLGLSPIMANDQATELEANRIESQGQGGKPGYVVARTPVGIARKPKAVGNPELELNIILAFDPMTAEHARRGFEAYSKLLDKKRKEIFDKHVKTGGIKRWMFALSKTDATENFVLEVMQVLRWVEEEATRAAAGLSDADIAEAQAKFKIAEAKTAAEAEAKAKAPMKPPPKVTPKDIEEQRKKKVESTSIAPPKIIGWDKKPQAERDKWEQRGKDVVKNVLALVAKKFPDVKLTAANFVADFRGVEARGAGVLAYGQTGPKSVRQAVFGYAFVEAAEADPAYVLSVVMHEIFGHPEYGPYGTEYHLVLYDLAQSKMPGYTKPAAGTQARRAEIDAYAYQETEIYSLLRSLPFHTPIAAKDLGKGLVSIDPKATVTARIGLIKTQWKAEIAVALLRGLHQRLLFDPRISGLAMNAFEEGVKLYFPKEAATINVR